jgi:hypothetical protein
MPIEMLMKSAQVFGDPPRDTENRLMPFSDALTAEAAMQPSSALIRTGRAFSPIVSAAHCAWQALPWL